MRNRRPQARVSLTKSRLQRWLGACGSVKPGFERRDLFDQPRHDGLRIRFELRHVRLQAGWLADRLQLPAEASEFDRFLVIEQRGYLACGCYVLGQYFVGSPQHISLLGKLRSDPERITPRGKRIGFAHLDQGEIR